ncbi:MAG: hypothetical protein AAF192_07885 [Pseudomonadota bacterium]
MKRDALRLLTIALPALLAACVGPASVTGTETIDGRYEVAGVRWESGTIAGVAVRLYEIAGETGLCGAYLLIDGGVFTDEIAVVAKQSGAIQHGNTRLLSGLTALPGPYDGADAGGKTAACLNTGVRWRPEFAAMEDLKFIPPTRIVL